MLGFTEKEVGHMTLNKWSRLYEHYKEIHNMRINKKLFITKRESEEDEEWIKG